MTLEIRKSVKESFNSIRNAEEELTDAAKIIEAAKAMGNAGGANLIENLLDLDFDSPSPTAGASSSIPTKTNQLLDLLSMDEPLSAPSQSISQPPSVLLSAESAEGLEIVGSFALRYL